MKKYIVEYTTQWSDGAKDYEQTLNIRAENLEQAKNLGKKELQEMDESDNRYAYCVSRTYYRTVLEDDFQYHSSMKEDNGIYRDAGYIDVVALKNFL